MIEGVYRVAGSNGIIGFHSKHTTNETGITIGRSGNIGTPHFYKDNFRAHNTVLYVKDFKGNSDLFLFYFFYFSDKQLRCPLQNPQHSKSKPFLSKIKIQNP
jgi:type I restriction enzyme S subunit